MCCVCGREWESDPTIACAITVLGTGASFMEGFMSFTEASIIAGTKSGGSCSTNCGELHPLT